MKQSFDVRGGPQFGRQNLPLIRDALKDAGLYGFFLPHEDEYQNEYLPDANERLAWATGFTGSAGAALFCVDTAIVFVDGRYTLQAVDQVDASLFQTISLTDPGPFGWMKDQALDGKTIGYDPKLMTPDAVTRMRDAVESVGGEIRACGRNPVDAAWADRPSQPMAKLAVQPLAFSGKAASEKRAEIAASLKKSRLDTAFLTAPTSIAWLFNIRGGDVDYSPLPLARAALHSDGSADLFVDAAKVTDEVREHLGNEVAIHNLDELESWFDTLTGRKIRLDPSSASEWFFETAKAAGGIVVPGPDPIALPKALKNPVEIEGSARAHARDGVAVARFLHWLATEAQSGEVTEIEAVTKLEHLREETGGLKDLSFDTISGAGPNGAIVHYRVSTATDAKLARGSLFLVDFGGQYMDGTTDITRTVAIGEPTDEMKRHYTLVLKGHIALSRLRFPKGTTGTHIDMIARHALWQAGLDYQHGTGHGVGSYLGVHEGPQRIAKPWNEIALAPGMIVSNEPGYYKTGAYGIRIENLQYVTEPQGIEGGETPMMGFVTLTRAPLERGLMDLSLLDVAEIAWVNAYHSDVKSALLPRMSEYSEAAAWVETACAAIG